LLLVRVTSKRVPESAEKTVRDIRRTTRRHHSAEGKIRIVLEGLAVKSASPNFAARRGSTKTSITVGRRSSRRRARSGWLAIRRVRQTSDEIKDLKAEARQLKEILAEVLIENRLLRKGVLGDGEDAS